MSKLFKIDDEEKWTHIDGLSIGYEISSYGNVRENFGDHYEELKLSTNSKGYKLLYLKGATYRVHVLVAKAFVDNPENKTMVRHIDGDKSNNHASNLVWVSPSENTQYLTKRGLNGEAIRCKEDSKVFATINSASAYYMIPADLIRKSLKTGDVCFSHTFEYLDRSEIDESRLIYISSSLLSEISKTLASPDKVKSYIDSQMKTKSTNKSKT